MDALASRMWSGGPEVIWGLWREEDSSLYELPIPTELMGRNLCSLTCLDLLFLTTIPHLGRASQTTFLADGQWSCKCVPHSVCRPNDTGVMAEDRTHGTHLGLLYLPSGWFRGQHPVCILSSSSHKTKSNYHLNRNRREYIFLFIYLDSFFISFVFGCRVHFAYLLFLKYLFYILTQFSSPPLLPALPPPPHCLPYPLFLFLFRICHQTDLGLWSSCLASLVQELQLQGCVTLKMEGR